MIVARILDPCSKLSTCRELEDESASRSLGEVLGLGTVDLDEMYEAMDVRTWGSPCARTRPPQ